MIRLTVKINKKDTWCFISCLLILFPTFFSSIMSSIGGNYIRYVMYLAAFILAIYIDGFTVFRWQFRMFLPWALILAICLLNRNGDLQYSYIAYFINMLAPVLFSVFFIAKDEDFMRNAFRVIVVCLCVQLVVGIFLWLSPSTMIRIGSSLFGLESGTYYYRQFINQVNLGAFMGITSHYSTSGMYMALAVILMAAYLLVERQKTLKWNAKYIIPFIIFFIALILTQKRAHLLFSVIAFLIMYLVGYTKGNLRRRIIQILGVLLGFVIIFAILLQIPVFQNIISRFFSADTLDELSTGRVSNLWEPAWNEFLQNPILGIGWRQFKYLHPVSGGTVNNDVHNIYLQLLAENGIILGGFIIAFIVVTFVMTWKLVLRYKIYPRENIYTFLLFSFGYQIFFILYGFTGNPLYDIQCFFPYVICCCIAYRCRYLNKLPIKNKDELYGVKAL